MAEMKTLNGNTFVDQTARDELATIKQTVSGIPKFSIEVVTALPTITEASTATVYLVPSVGADGNLYTEWICVEHGSGLRAWEKLGVQNLDLTGYVTDEELSAAINAALAQAKASGEFKGETGETGPRGPQGPAYTLTETDKALIVAQVIESLGGNPIFGYVDEDNNIIVQGNLGDGTYSVKYEMEDGSTVDIGNLVLDTNVYYSITKNLTNCAIDNSATQVVAGGSYSATVTANSGYTLDSVSVTMGGSAVSVSGGVISIASVTGNIVITAVAEEKAVTPNYTNLANPNSSDWMEGYRLNSSGEPTETTDGSQTVLTHYIDCVQGDVIRIKGLTMGSYRVALYTGSTTKTNYKAANPVFPSSDTVWECEEESPGVYKFIIKYASTSAMRFSGIPVGTSNDVIITKNEPIS